MVGACRNHDRISVVCRVFRLLVKNKFGIPLLDAEELVNFRMDFVADLFADPQKAAEARASIAAAPGQILATRLYAYKERRSIRVVFDLDPGSESYSELRLVLKAADQPVSETWLYRWTA